jgi:glucose-1-phosphate thymidylyltransferase
MRGIVLAGGKGSRLWPVTLAVNKHLLPVFDKPMIFYPIATLMASGIREIAIITNPHDREIYSGLLGSGEHLGIEFTYLDQKAPKGIAEAFIIAENFIRGHKVALILGDNVFHGTGMGRQLADYLDISGAHIFAYKVSDPTQYGVIEFDLNGNVQSIQEKPLLPKSSFAIPGLYFLDDKCLDFAKLVEPSARGELEITDILEQYKKLGELKTSVLPRGTAWLDTGTVEALHEASSYVRIIEQRQGRKIACLEEIAWRQNWIDSKKLNDSIQKYGNSEYAKYLSSLPAQENDYET